MSDRPYAKELDAYCRLAVQRLRPRSIILFGSMATGKYGVGSDIDLLVISEDLPKNFLERLRILAELNQTFAPIQALGYTPEEFLAMLRRRHPTALFAVAEGKALYDDGFFLHAREVFEQVKAEFDLVRTERGWDARRLSSRLT